MRDSGLTGQEPFPRLPDPLNPPVDVRKVSQDPSKRPYLKTGAWLKTSGLNIYGIISRKLFNSNKKKNKIK